MKKSFLLAVCMLTFLEGWCYQYYTFSDTSTGQTLYYYINTGYAVVCAPEATSLNAPPWTRLSWGSYTQPTGSLIIPDSVSYQGISYAVVSIGGSAFENCSGLTSVTIPQTITYMGYGCFRNCNNLTTVIFNAESCTAAGGGGNESSANFQYPAFYQCSNLSCITFGNNVKVIPAYICCWLTSISSIIIPDSVLTIGMSAFANSGLTNLYITATTPPTLSSGISSSVSIHIPCATYEAYHSSWGNYTFLEPLSNINITLASNNTLWGQTSVIQRAPMYTDVRCDSTAVIQATPNYGYHFDHWSTGSTQSLDTVHLTGNCTITAYFAKNQYTVTALANQGDRGSVTGSATVDYLDNVTLTASANYGYHFSHWSDGSTDNPHQVTANENKTIYAYFDPNQYLLNVQSADATMGNVSGGGSFDYLSNHTISATANYGYHFEQWNDGMATSSRTVTLTQDTTFTATFGKNQYTLNVQSNDASLGTVTGSGTYEYLDTVEITATAIEHHHFVRWSDGNTNNPRVYQVTGDASITAIFAIDSHYVNVTCDIARGTVSGSGYYAYGSACTVTAENPYTGFVFHSWSNGVTANPYVFAVLDDIELYAIFVAEGEEVYTVTVESADPSMGTASGGGQALSGGEVVIWATSNPGHRFVRWNDNNTDSVRTVVVTADVTYTAYFEATTQGVNEVLEDDIRINVQNGQIIFEGVDDNVVRVFDMYGRLVDNRRLPTGVYLVKIGNHPARKVVVIR